MNHTVRVIKGTTVLESDLGHNNFLYPSDRQRLIEEDCDATRLSWVGSNEYTPVQIPGHAIGAKSQFSIVWILNELFYKGAQRLRQGEEED